METSNSESIATFMDWSFFCKQEKLYAQLCCIAYLLDRILPSNTFKAKLKILIDNTPLIDIAAMGFPKDWAKEPLWR